MAKSGAKLICIAKDVDHTILVREYLSYKKSQGVTEHTITNHKSGLKYFFDSYTGDIRDSKRLREAVGRFLNDRKNEYYNKLLQTLRQFFDYCIRESVIRTNPCEGFKYKSHTTRIVQHSQDTIERLLKLPNRATFSGLRDYILMLLMLDTGIRPNELLQLKAGDIDGMSHQVIVREEYSKTRQLRVLPISDIVENSVKKLIKARHPQWAADVPIFCSFSGHRLTSHNLQEKFREYGKRLGVTITPYHLRHTFALWFIRNNGNIFALQKIMGHAKLDMTRHYLNLAQADIEESHKKASPLNTLFQQNKRVIRIKKRG